MSSHAVARRPSLLARFRALTGAEAVLAVAALTAVALVVLVGSVVLAFYLWLGYLP